MANRDVKDLNTAVFYCTPLPQLGMYWSALPRVKPITFHQELASESNVHAPNVHASRSQFTSRNPYHTGLRILRPDRSTPLALGIYWEIPPHELLSPQLPFSPLDNPLSSGVYFPVHPSSC